MHVFEFLAIRFQMDPLTARIILVIALVGALECSYVYFTRRCYFFQISHGIRKEPWQKDAIHYCYLFITDDTSSKYIRKNLSEYKFILSKQQKISYRNIEFLYMVFSNREWRELRDGWKRLFLTRRNRIFQRNSHYTCCILCNEKR